jgi:hypothetical protein
MADLLDNFLNPLKFFLAVARAISLNLNDGKWEGVRKKITGYS